MKRIITFLICMFFMLSLMPSGYASDKTNIAFAFDGNADVAEIFADLSQYAPDDTHFTVATPKTSFTLHSIKSIPNILRGLSPYTGDFDVIELLTNADFSVGGGPTNKIIILSTPLISDELIKKAQSIEERSSYTVYLVTNTPAPSSYAHTIYYTDLSELYELLRQIPIFRQSKLKDMEEKTPYDFLNITASGGPENWTIKGYIKENGNYTHRFVPPKTGYYQITNSTSEAMPLVYITNKTGNNAQYLQIFPSSEHGNSYLLGKDSQVLISTVGDNNMSFTQNINFTEPVTVAAPAKMEFTPAGEGTFIYSNNIEAIQELSDLADNGADSKMLMKVSGLTANGITRMGDKMPNSNKYTFVSEHANHIPDEDIIFDLQFSSAQGAVIEITALGVGQTWLPMNLNQNYIGSNIDAMPSAVIPNSPNIDTFTTATITIDNSGKWLKDIYEEIKGADTYPVNHASKGPTPTFLLFNFNVLEGAVDLNFMAYRNGNRQNVNMSAAAPYRWDRQYKGYAASLPKMQTNLEFTIDDSISGYLPVTVSNMRNPDGIQVNEWGTGINPQSDLYGQATYGAESAILPLEYYDISKMDLYGSAIDESEKEDTWYFDTKRTDLNKEIQYGYFNGANKILATLPSPQPDFKPNAPLGNLTALNDYGINVPWNPSGTNYKTYNIGYGYNVTSYDAAANLGNYWVELEYAVTVHNLGSERTIEYRADGPGDYIINTNGVLQNRGENSGNITMDTFTIPNGTHKFIFSVMLYSPHAAALKNSLNLLPLN